MGQGGQALTGGRSHCPYAGSDGQKLRLALCGHGWGSAVQADAVDGPKNRRPCDGQRSVRGSSFRPMLKDDGGCCLRGQNRPPQAGWCRAYVVGRVAEEVAGVGAGAGGAEAVDVQVAQRLA